MAKKATKKPMMPEIEDVASKFMETAAEAGFKFAPGTDIAHVASMQLSVAASMKRLADRITQWEDHLLSISVSLKHQNDILVQIREILAPKEIEKQETWDQEVGTENTTGDPLWIDRLEEEINKAILEKKRPSFLSRVLDRIAPRTGRPIYPSEK